MTARMWGKARRGSGKEVERGLTSREGKEGREQDEGKGQEEGAEVAMAIESSPRQQQEEGDDDMAHTVASSTVCLLVE